MNLRRGDDSIFVIHWNHRLKFQNSHEGRDCKNNHEKVFEPQPSSYYQEHEALINVQIENRL